VNQTDQKQSYQMNQESVEIPGLPMRASRIGLGTWAMGGWMWGGTDQIESAATIREALEQGINLIDTAPVCVAGWSIDRVTRAAIDRILSDTIPDPIGPEFMAPLPRS
jgi:aryl-alcohol dehydrogenase-like predicted oxidoreductase